MSDPMSPLSISDGNSKRLVCRFFTHLVDINILSAKKSPDQLDVLVGLNEFAETVGIAVLVLRGVDSLVQV